MIKIFDGHSDIFEDVDEKRQRGLDKIIENGHLAKWKQSNCTSGFCPIWVDPFCDVYADPVEEQFKKIVSHMEKELDSNPYARAVVNYSEYSDAVDSGIHAVILGAEGLSFLHGDAGKLDELFEKKLRIFSLSWNEENEFAEGSGVIPLNGLSEKGKSAIKKIEQSGGILDLAHTNIKTFTDMAKTASRSFVVSHANIAALLPHPRNLNDEQLKIVKDCSGVVGISAYPPFISASPSEWNLKRFCDNIEYVADKIGVDYVGLGFDFVDFLDDFGSDASISMSLDGLEGIHKAQGVVSELISRGVSAVDIEKICHGNFERIIKELLG